MRGRLLCITMMTAFMLSACGVKGELDTPPPMWGDGSNAEQSDKTSDNDSN